MLVYSRATVPGDPGVCKPEANGAETVVTMAIGRESAMAVRLNPSSLKSHNYYPIAD